MLIRKLRKRTILVCVRGRHKIGWKKQNIDPMWKVLVKEVDLGEPTSFLDQVYLGCTQRECETSKDIVDNYRDMFESRISAGATETLPYSEKLGANSSEMRGKILRTCEQHVVTVPSLIETICEL